MILRKKKQAAWVGGRDERQSVGKQRLIGLDLFRIAAAMITFFFHSIIHFECSYGVFQSFLRMGAVMMTGFFMLSGFSLYYVCSEQDLMTLESMKQFLKKRLIGILPAYFVTGLLYIITQGEETLLQNLVLLPVEVLGLQSVFSSLFSVSHIGGTWFISCIILCYVCFPFILSLLKQMNERTKIIWGGVNCFILLEAPFVVWAFNLNNIYSNPFFRMLEFIIGAILASVINELRENRVISKVLLRVPAVICEIIVGILAISLGMGCQIAPGNYMLYSWIVLPLFIAILPTLATIEFQIIKKSAVFCKLISNLSEISYAFFLAQLFIWPIMRRLCDVLSIESNISKILLSFVVCTMIAIILHELIEKPCKKSLSRKLLRT